MIPLATTQVTILRNELEAGVTDPADNVDPTVVTIALDVRATIGAPSANAALSTGTRVVYTARLVADPCDIEPEDTVIDQTDGTEWVCVWAKQYGPLLPHVEAQLRHVTGAT